MTANEIKLLRWAVRMAHQSAVLAPDPSIETLGGYNNRIEECNKILRREAAALKAALASRASKHKGARK